MHQAMDNGSPLKLGEYLKYKISKKEALANNIVTDPQIAVIDKAECFRQPLRL